MKRNLAAFDFDHTIIDGNSDTTVENLVSPDLITDSVKKLITGNDWTNYLQGVFNILHENGITEENIVSALHGLPLVPGMLELIHTMVQDLNYDVIIISNGNTYFLNILLEKLNLKDKIYKVFTNPAVVIDGVICLSKYHVQTECGLCTINLCKGRIMEEFVASQAKNGIVYDKVMYIGDGSYDLCPILRLDEKKLACVRYKFECFELIQLINAGKPIPATGKTYKLNANVFVWNSGLDILEVIRK